MKTAAGRFLRDVFRLGIGTCVLLYPRGSASPKPDADLSLLALDGRGVQERPGLRSWVLREDGSHVAVEVPGLGSFEAWEVLELLFVMFRDEDFLVVSPITFEACFENFQQLAKKLFESWHLCQAAEDRSHAKHFLCEECSVQLRMTTSSGFGRTDTRRLGSWRELAVAGFACCLLAASFHVLFQLAPLFLGCSWFRGSSLLHTCGQLPKSTVLTFTTRRAPQKKPEETGRQWVFLGETIAQRCASPGRRRRPPICATGLSFWQLAYSCECFSNSLALTFGSSGVFLLAAFDLFLLAASYQTVFGLCPAGWDSVEPHGRCCCAIVRPSVWSGGSPPDCLWLVAAAAAIVASRVGLCSGLAVLQLPCLVLVCVSVSLLCFQSLGLVVYLSFASTWAPSFRPLMALSFFAVPFWCWLLRYLRGVCRSIESLWTLVLDHPFCLGQ